MAYRAIFIAANILLVYLNKINHKKDKTNVNQAEETQRGNSSKKKHKSTMKNFDKKLNLTSNSLNGA